MTFRQQKHGRRLRLIACAILMLVVGVAGSASAAVLIGGKAAVLIGSKQVKDGSLTGRDLRLGTVRGSDVRDQSLTASDFAVVPKGPPGGQGDPGDPGSNGSPGLTVVPESVTIVGKSTVTLFVACTPPQKAIFGGSLLPGQVDTMQSAPETDASHSQWDFVIRNRSIADQVVTLEAYCVTDR